MRMAVPGAKGGPADGHDPEQGRGRCASAYVEAMEALLALEQVAAKRAFWSPVGGETEGRIHYLDLGRGRPLVLVQGGGGGGANWFRVLGPLSARFRVLAPDLPGFGLSSWEEPERPLGRMGADRLAAWLDGVGVDTFDIVGTSLGGLLAFRLAQRWPERVGRLVLLSSVGFGRAVPWAVRLATMPGVGAWVLRPRRAGTRWVFERYLTTNRVHMSAVRQTALVEYLYRSELMGDAGRMARALRAFCGVRGQREIVSAGEMKSLGTPTLVVWGGRDRFLPLRHGERAASGIPSARLAVIPDAGHSPNWESPGPFLDVLLPFLTRSSGGAGEPASASSV